MLPTGCCQQRDQPRVAGVAASTGPPMSATTSVHGRSADRRAAPPPTSPVRAAIRRSVRRPDRGESTVLKDGIARPAIVTGGAEIVAPTHGDRFRAGAARIDTQPLWQQVIVANGINNGCSCGGEPHRLRGQVTSSTARRSSPIPKAASWCRHPATKRRVPESYDALTVPVDVERPFRRATPLRRWSNDRLLRDEPKNPRPSHTTVPTAAAASTDGAALVVTMATISRTRKPAASATSLYTGQGTPAMQHFVAHRHSLTIARNQGFGQPKHRIRGSVFLVGLSWLHATFRRIRTEHIRLGPRERREVHGVGRHRGHRDAGQARHPADHHRREERQDPQDTADAGGAQRRVRDRGIAGRGSRRTRSGTTTSRPNRASSCRTAPLTKDYEAREVSATRRPPGGNGRWRPGPTTPSTRRRPTGRSRSSCSHPVTSEIPGKWHHRPVSAELSQTLVRRRCPRPTSKRPLSELPAWSRKPAADQRAALGGHRREGLPEARGPAGGAVLQVARRLQPADAAVRGRDRRRRGVLVGGQSRAGFRDGVPVDGYPRPGVHARQDAEAEARPHPLPRPRVHRADRRRQDLRRGRGRALEDVARTGATLVPPYDDPRTMAGQGTIAAEMLDQLDGEPDLVIVPVGGGGCIAGITTYLAERTRTRRCSASSLPAPRR